MFFRFGSAVVLVVLISVAGIALEKQSLELRREVSRQHYRMDVLWKDHATLRWRTQELGAPVRLIGPLESGAWDVSQPEQPIDAEPRRIPLLRWQRSESMSR
jgi:hypothetical protein